MSQAFFFIFLFTTKERHWDGKFKMSKLGGNYSLFYKIFAWALKRNMDEKRFFFPKWYTTRNNNWVYIRVPCVILVGDSCRMLQTEWCPPEGESLISRGQVAILGLPGMRHPPLPALLIELRFIGVNRGNEKKNRAITSVETNITIMFWKLRGFFKHSLKYSQDLCVYCFQSKRAKRST